MIVQDKVVEEIVIVRQTAPFRLIPEEVTSEITINIGSSFKKGTKSLLMGLNPSENRLILPEIIQVDPDSPNWEAAVKDYYTNLTIHIPQEGLRLDKAMTKMDKWIQGQRKEVDYPVNPDQYIMYRQLLADPRVANTPDKVGEGIYKAYIVDENAEKQKSNMLRKDRNKIIQKYSELVSTDENGRFTDAQTMRLVLFNFGLNPDAYDADECAAKLEQYKDISLEQLKDGIDILNTDLMRVASDPNLKIKGLINKLIILNAIKPLNNYFVDPANVENIYGKTIEDVVAYWSNPANNETVMRWKHLLKESKKFN